MSKAAVGYATWVAPTIGAEDVAEGVSAEEVAEVLEQARREGHAEGHAEGLRAGQKDIRQRVQRLDQLHRALSSPLEQIDEDIQRRIAELALALAQQVLRVELEMRPETLLPLVREAVAKLAPGGDPPTIHLYPADARLLGELLLESGEGADWDLVADERVSAGGCRVHSGYMEIDATLATRLEAVTANLRRLIEEELQS